MKLQFIDRERDDAWLLGQQIERGNNRFIGAEKSNLGLTANRLSHILVILYVCICIYLFICDNHSLGMFYGTKVDIIFCFIDW